MIFVNYKLYESGTGESAVEVVKMIEGVVEITQVKIIPVVRLWILESFLDQPNLRLLGSGC
jgi:hypothetical protein